MRPDILIVGQGLAGTLLGWELERAGLAFEIADAEHEAGASSVAAGMINPITGRRLVKSARVETLRPIAQEIYRGLEAEFGLRFWREMRLRRVFADERERRVLAEKQARGELAPFLGSVDEKGFWIEGAAHINMRVLMVSARDRWRRKGLLRAENVDVAAETKRYQLVVDCSGAALIRSGDFRRIPWQFSKGEMLEISVQGLPRDTILNCGHWILPVANGVAWVGATHEPGVVDNVPTPHGRAMLEASARTLLDGRPFTVTGHRAGVRVNLPDKQPVAGRHPKDERRGLINGLGAKGALLGPILAQQWANYLTKGGAFDAEFDVARFGANL